MHNKENVITINGVDYAEDQLTKYQKELITSVQRCGNDISNFSNQVNDLSTRIDKLNFEISIYERAKAGFVDELLKNLAENDLGEMVLPEPEVASNPELEAR